MDEKLKDALFGCTTENHENWALRGIYFCDDFIVASDSTVFVKVTRPFDLDEYVMGRDGNPIPVEYPNIKHGVIPVPVDPEMTSSVTDLRHAAELIPKSPDEKGKRIAINLCGSCLYPPRLLSVLKVFEVLEDESLALMPYTDRLVLRGDKAIALVMSLGVRASSHPLIENYTVESINLMADLL